MPRRKRTKAQREAKAAYDKARRDKIRGRYKDARRNRYRNDPEYRAKHALWAKQQYATNPEFRKQLREGALRRKFGLDYDAYTALVKKQRNKCALCRIKFEEGFSKSPRVDHCHKTGKIRGLLCNTCNLREGWVAKIGIKRLVRYYEDAA